MIVPGKRRQSFRQMSGTVFFVSIYKCDSCRIINTVFWLDAPFVWFCGAREIHRILREEIWLVAFLFFFLTLSSGRLFSIECIWIYVVSQQVTILTNSSKSISPSPSLSASRIISVIWISVNSSPSFFITIFSSCDEIFPLPSVSNISNVFRRFSFWVVFYGLDNKYMFLAAYTKIYTLDTYKSLHHKSIRFALFWEIFENRLLKTILNSKISINRYYFWTILA